MLCSYSSVKLLNLLKTIKGHYLTHFSNTLVIYTLVILAIPIHCKATNLLFVITETDILRFPLDSNFSVAIKLILPDKICNKQEATILRLWLMFGNFSVGPIIT